MAVVGIRWWWLERAKTRDIPGLPEELTYDYGLRSVHYDIDGHYWGAKIRPDKWWPTDRWIRAVCACCKNAVDLLECEHFSYATAPSGQYLPGFYAFREDCFDKLVEYLATNVALGQWLRENGYVLCLGKVLLGGTIMVHEYGYRAEYARAWRLFGPDPDSIYVVEDMFFLFTRPNPLDLPVEVLPPRDEAYLQMVLAGTRTRAVGSYWWANRK